MTPAPDAIHRLVAAADALLARSTLLITGPVSGAKLEPAAWAGIEALRSVQYERRAPYLLSPALREGERRAGLDERGAHVVAWHQGRVVGAIRLTLAPYEFALSSGELAQAAEGLRDHVELSRFIVAPDLPRLSGSSLLLAAAVRGAVDLGARGLVALCRLPAVRLFQRSGMRPCDGREHVLRERGGQRYRLLHASWPDIAQAVLGPEPLQPQPTEST
jgi:hypothetical protein